MKNSPPLFKPVSPFAVGQARRAHDRAVAAWLQAHEGHIVTGSGLPYGWKLPAGWWLDTSVSIPAIPGHGLGRFGYAPGVPALPRYVPRRGSVPPPRKPRYRVNASLGDPWRPVSDEELRRFGEDPNEYQPGPATPPEQTQIRTLALCVVGFIVLIAALFFAYVSQAPTQSEPTTCAPVVRIT